MTNNQKRMAAIFNEWARRYAENPDAFSEILDEDGNPVSDYGERCARYFEELEGEMVAEGVLPEYAHTV